MYSQCPDCLTRFRVTAAHLRAAGGTVRCGRCGAAFDALATLTDSAQGNESSGGALAGAVSSVLTESRDTPAAAPGAYHFSADDLERVFIDAREWQRQFGRSVPVAEPDEVAAAARAAAAASGEDTRTQAMPVFDEDFETPAWAADIDDGDLDSTQPLPVLRNAPEAALFEDEPAEAPQDRAAEPSTAIDEPHAAGAYVPARVEPEVEAIFEPSHGEPIDHEIGAAPDSEAASEAASDTPPDVAFEAPAPDADATPLDVELDAQADEDFADLDVELSPAPADDRPATLDVELEAAEATSDSEVDPLLLAPLRSEETAIVASFELPDERAATPTVEPGAEAEPTAVRPAATAIEPEVWNAPMPVAAPAAASVAGATAGAAGARGSAAEIPLSAGRWRATRDGDTRPDADEIELGDGRRFAWGWALGCLVLLLALAAQYLHQQRDTLRRDARLGPWIDEAYARLGQPLPMLADPSLYELRQQGNVADSAPGTLHVRATLTNEAGFAQPAPLLRIALEDRFGNAVAVRDFTPSEYLPAGETAPERVAPGTQLPVDLVLLDPGGDAVGFQLRPCMPDEAATGRLRCSP